MQTDVVIPPLPRQFGTVAIVGRPNVGKSTLLNSLIGQKLSITSDKAQTTRHRLLGLHTEGSVQFAFVDTPGFQVRHTRALNRAMNRTVTAALAEVDVVLWVIEAGHIDPEDERVGALIPSGKPIVLVANKLDRVQSREKFLPWLQGLGAHKNLAEIVPLSARKSTDAKRLLAIIASYLPAGEWGYDADALTDRSERFLAAARQPSCPDLDVTPGGGFDRPVSSAPILLRCRLQRAALHRQPGGPIRPPASRIFRRLVQPDRRCPWQGLGQDFAFGVRLRFGGRLVQPPMAALVLRRRVDDAGDMP